MALEIKRKGAKMQIRRKEFRAGRRTRNVGEIFWKGGSPRGCKSPNLHVKISQILGRLLNYTCIKGNRTQ